MNAYLAVFLGGGLGSLCRFALGKVSLRYFPTIFPVGTLLANIISTFILGITVYVVYSKIPLPDSLRFFLLIGFCGGFSTFSTFSFETVELFRIGAFTYAIANIFVSVLLSVFLLFIIYRVTGYEA